MTTTCTTPRPTTHELLSLSELINMESVDLQKTQAILPMIGDDDLRQSLSTCVQTGQTHLKALVALCQEKQITQ